MTTLNINLKNRATTQYLNYSFNSMVRFGDKVLGANSYGLFNLIGDTDNTVLISAYFSPVMTDFGISNPKRMRYIYLGYEASGNLQVDIQADELTARSYTVVSSKTGQQRKRVVCGRDGKGRYWTFTFKNVSGCDFSIDSVQVMPIVLNHGLS
jgi:hypothetical protein